MNEKVRPVIALMKARGATKEEIDQMNLYFDKYNLDETYAQVYKAMQRITIEEKRKKRKNVIKQLEDMGYSYSIDFFDISKKNIIGYTFTLEDNGDAFIVHIEDHRDDPNINDFLIWSALKSGEKDWFGNLIKTEGCVEYSAMKLIIEFIDILKGENG